MWAQARTVRFLAMDVDGVLTDGGIVFDDQGHELKNFHVHDGQGIALAHRAGLHIAWISGRESSAVRPIRCKSCKHCWSKQAYP
jgi:3-deoxy-D-manno-octulosonate 8-phosphate phosphatase (KDO 8-P phosphatase)